MGICLNIWKKLLNNIIKVKSLKKLEIKQEKKLTKIYLEADRNFNLQEGWYGVLAYFLALINMIQRVVNLDTKYNDIFSFVMYVGAMLIWLVLVKRKCFMSEKVECLVNQFNMASASMSIINLAIFYLAVIVIPEVWVLVCIIIFGVFWIVGLTIDGLKKHEQYLKSES